MISLNKERAIARVVKDIKRVVPDAEIVVVHSSTDRTAEIATQLGCVVVKQFPPKGYGLEMDRALTFATSEIIIRLDCDDTYPVESIYTLIETINEGYDLVSGSRLGHKCYEFFIDYKPRIGESKVDGH